MIRRAAALLSCVLLALSVGSSAAAAGLAALKIVAIGDSIGSVGYGSPDGCGYRTELTRLLTDAGVVVTWAGSPRNGAPTGPNDCPYGTRQPTTAAPITVQALLYGNDVGQPGAVKGGPGSVEEWIASDDPDVAIILVGTNNAAGTPPGLTNFGADYRDLVQRIYTAKPTVKVVVTWIPYSAAPWATYEVNINIDIYTWVVAFFPQVLFVNLAQYPTRLMFDGVHPSDYGPIARLIYAPLATAYGLPAGPQDSYALTTANCRPGYERAPTAITC